MYQILVDGSSDMELELSSSGEDLTKNEKKLDEKYEELAGTIFQRCNKLLESDACFDIPQYPIAEIQQKRQLEHQINVG